MDVQVVAANAALITEKRGLVNLLPPMMSTRRTLHACRMKHSRLSSVQLCAVLLYCRSVVYGCAAWCSGLRTGGGGGVAVFSPSRLVVGEDVEEKFDIVRGPERTAPLSAVQMVTLASNLKADESRSSQRPGPW